MFSPFCPSRHNERTIQRILLLFSYAILSKTHTLPVANLLFTYYTKRYTETNRHLSQDSDFFYFSTVLFLLTSSYKNKYILLYQEFQYFNYI